MKLLQQTLNASNDILGDPELREQIKQTISEMPVMLEETRGAVERIERHLRLAGARHAEHRGPDQAAGRRRAGPVDELDTSMNNVNQLSDNLLQFSQKLNDPQGSLGALLHDKELYQHVNHMAKNLDELTRDLKPILNDARVFTDKIARHPELLGVRGAIKKDAGLKDSPSNDDSETDVPPRPAAGRSAAAGGGASADSRCTSSSSVVGPPLIGRRAPRRERRAWTLPRAAGSDSSPHGARR